MTRTPRGRDGSADEVGHMMRSAGALLRSAPALLIVAVALAVGGCSSKKPEANPGAGAGQGQSGLGQEGVGGSSLAQFQKGTLGAGGQGPLSDIHFDFDAYTVRAQDGDILKANADWLQKNPQSRVQVEGHCDERGSEEYNLALGAKRAQAAKDYLQTLGVSGDRMSTISYGKELPLCSDSTEDCYQQNRRDHFAVSQ